jgi:hypothetical protein
MAGLPPKNARNTSQSTKRPMPQDEEVKNEERDCAFDNRRLMALFDVDRGDVVTRRTTPGTRMPS